MSVTLRQIADATGVSIPAVSLVLNGKGQKYSAKTRKRIQSVAADLGYRPSAAARVIRGRKTKQIGILVPNNPKKQFTHPNAYETVLGINQGLQDAGYVAVLSRLTDVNACILNQSRLFKEQMLDGMIVLDSMPEPVESQLDSMFRSVVWCDSNIWRDTGCIRRDERYVGEQIAQAAVNLGYKKAVWFTYDRKPGNLHYSSRERLQGIQSVFKKHKVSLQTEIETDFYKMDPEGRLASHLRDDTVVICDSVYQAQKIRNISEGVGKRAGWDFGLMCTDDKNYLRRFWHNLTRVRFDRFRMGLEAAAMMLKMLEHGPNKCPSFHLKDDFHPGNSAWGPAGRSGRH